MLQDVVMDVSILVMVIAKTLVLVLVVLAMVDVRLIVRTHV